MQHNIGAHLADWVDAEFGALVENVAEKDHCVAGHGVEIFTLLFIAPALERIIAQASSATITPPARPLSTPRTQDRDAGESR